MAVSSPSIHVCDKEDHHDLVAEAFCQYHKKLLCIQCLVEKTKAPSPECSLIPIRDAVKEKDVAILNCLSIRQICKQKQKKIEKHEEKVDKIKNDLEQKVNAAHANISARLDAMRDKCLHSINEQVQSITSVGKTNKIRLQEIDKNLNEFMDALSVDNCDDFDEIQSKINDIQKDIDKSIPEKNSIPQGEFKRDENFHSFIMQSGTTLGNVNVIDPDEYEEIDNKIVPQHVHVSSDEIVYDRNKVTQVPVGLERRNDQVPKGKAKSPTKSPDCNAEKRPKSFFRFFGFQREKTDRSKDKKSEKESETSSNSEKSKKDKQVSASSPNKVEGDTEEIYKDSNFIQPKYKPPKYLINKSVNMNIKEEDFTTACKFSKLVGLGKNYVGLLSDVHKSLVFVGTEGQFLGRKRLDATKIAVTAIGDADVAVLTEPKCLVRKFKVSERGFETTGSFMIGNISNITGFDYDLSSSKYAVSSCDKIIILDKSGQEVSSVQYSDEASNIITTFDFKNECLYILKLNENTLKSFSLKKLTVEWRRKIDSNSVILRNMCLHRDKLYLACSNAVAIFSAGTGAPIIRHEINDLLDDCLGICVIDDVLVLSSNSDNFVKSASLAYIGM